ncbi:MAG: hypothetical protein U5L96_04805 [Owenweeksia sp.]|nr:hypothetical protein [Owenweeksia sp.]
MNQSAKVFMPTGFRPGSDIAKNRTFGPSLRFEDVEKYHFYIMNRWGVKIFETRDPEVRWTAPRMAKMPARACTSTTWSTPPRRSNQGTARQLYPGALSGSQINPFRGENPFF